MLDKVLHLIAVAVSTGALSMVFATWVRLADGRLIPRKRKRTLVGSFVVAAALYGLSGHQLEAVGMLVVAVVCFSVSVLAVPEEEGEESDHDAGGDRP